MRLRKLFVKMNSQLILVLIPVILAVIQLWLQFLLKILIKRMQVRNLSLDLLRKDFKMY